MDAKRLVYNAARCKGCGLILQSVHRHDYKSHECEKEVDGTVKRIYVEVDGGLEYIRRGWAEGTRPDQNFEELSTYGDSPQVDFNNTPNFNKE